MSAGQPTLVLVEQAYAIDGWDGGVQRVVGMLEQGCRSLGVPAVRAGAQTVSEELRRIAPAHAVVFTQQEGGLSRDYALQAVEWLEHGATVVEKNVFAMPSRWRPRHPRYVMALMSLDGSHRLRLRSFLGGATRPTTWIHLMNPYERGPAASTTRDEDVDLHFLRVGRPDARKWSSFEIDFVRHAALVHPGMAFRLTLVGLPEEMARVELPPNVDLDVRPYLQRSQLNDLYSRAHVYLHHSRMGETFGNTLAEAAMHGTRIVLGSDAHWDCAPLEFIPARSIVGTPRQLCRSAPQLVGRLLDNPQESGQSLPDARAIVGRLLTLARHPAHGALPEPRLRDSLRYLMCLGEQIDGVTRRDCVRAAAVEVVRGYRRVRSNQ